MEKGQAQVVAENCIACGTCIAECPQNAKAYRTDVHAVVEWLAQDLPVAFSLAPSFAGSYSEWEQKRIPSALRMAGAAYVAETAEGAWFSASASADYISQNSQQHHICTACPAVVNYVRQYASEYAGLLVPVLSPMLVHARMMRKELGKTKIVFVGPCVAKKMEAQDENAKDMVDAVLTFEELDRLFELRGVKLDQCEESWFDGNVGESARLFPLEGGLLKTAGLKTDRLEAEHLAISGFNTLEAVLEALPNAQKNHWIIEPLFCNQGCINGPLAKKETTLFEQREAVLNYSRSGVSKASKTDDDLDLSAMYPPVRVNEIEYTEEQVKEVLHSIGKFSKEDELNCMACGYNSCREKAVAVIKGLAEPEMCMPYMRRMAEQKFEMMIRHDPNGIVMLDDKLQIIHMNPAFRKMFSCSEALIGRPISYLIDPDLFEQLATGNEQLIRKTVSFSNYNLVCHLMCYALPEQSQYVGIFMDITALQNNTEKLNEIKAETVLQAQSLIEHQIEMAQELARFLGEQTATGEVLLNKLIDSIQK
jgi:iron only hydrogenase large subunit-like protein